MYTNQQPCFVTLSHSHVNSSQLKPSTCTQPHTAAHTLLLPTRTHCLHTHHSHIICLPLHTPRHDNTHTQQLPTLQTHTHHNLPDFVAFLSNSYNTTSDITTPAPLFSSNQPHNLTFSAHTHPHIQQHTPKLTKTHTHTELTILPNSPKHIHIQGQI